MSPHSRCKTLLPVGGILPRSQRLPRGGRKRVRRAIHLLPTLLLAVLAFGFSVVVRAQTNIPVVSISALDAEIAENGGVPARFLISRTGPVDQPLLVRYVSAGTALNGVDYRRLSGKITIPAGTNAVVLLVDPLDDAIPELPETVAIKLSSPIDPFTIAILPDTQYYTGRLNGGSLDMFAAQTQWIVDHRDDWNIAFALHEGDCTEHNVDSEWQNTRACMDKLDGVVPYAVAVGNHDGTVWGDNTALFNQYFPLTNSATAATLGGVYESNRLDNCYQLFSAGGVDWMVISLEFGPRDSALDWANAVVTNFPNRKVIVLTHAHLAGDNTLLDASNTNHTEAPKNYARPNDGVDVWEKFVRRHANIAFVFNGHIGHGGLGQLVGIGDHGNKVYQMACNYQFNAYGGAGYLRLIQFDPAQDRFVAKSYSPYFGNYYTDPKNQFTYTNLGIFTNLAAPYSIDAQNGMATTTITSEDLDTNNASIDQASAAGFPSVVRVHFDRLLVPTTATNPANYSLSDGRSFSSANLLADGQTVLLQLDSNLNSDEPYVLTATGVMGVLPCVVTNPTTALSFSFLPVLMAVDSTDGTMGNWVVVDEGSTDGPSVWKPWNGGFAQFSNIYGPTPNNLSGRKGTFAYYNDPAAFAWNNFVFSVALQSSDDDGFGVMFCYHDPQNYYKFDMDRQRNMRKVFRVANGVETTLAAQNAGYAMNTIMALKIEVSPAGIAVSLDGQPLFGGPINDTTLTNGTVALYSWGNTGSQFSQIAVSPSTNAPAPQINLLDPINNAILPNATPIPLVAAVVSPALAVSQVDYFFNNTLLRRVFAPPYQASVAGLPPGVYRIDARVTDGGGRRSWAVPITVTLTVDPSAPVVTLRLERSDQGLLQISYDAPPAAVVSLEASSDLASWEPLGILPAPTNSLIALDPAGTTSPRRFYRAILSAP